MQDSGDLGLFAWVRCRRVFTADFCLRFWDFRNRVSGREIILFLSMVFPVPVRIFSVQIPDEKRRSTACIVLQDPWAGVAGKTQPYYLSAASAGGDGGAGGSGSSWRALRMTIDFCEAR